MDAFFECGARLFADEMADDATVATVKNCFGHGASPLGIHAAIERVNINAGLLAIIREARLIASEEAVDEIHVRIIVEADAENCEALRRILLFELNE